MPLQLDAFRTLAETGRHQQVLLDAHSSGPAEQIKTRGNFSSWVVNLFRGESVRNEQRAVAQAFMQALEGHVQQGSGESQQLSGALKSDYSAAIQEAVHAVRRQLANQLDGTQALTTDDIRSALGFVAQVQQETLTPLVQEAREDATLETAAQRLAAARQGLARFDEMGTGEKSPGQFLADYITGLRPGAADVAAAEAQIDSLSNAFMAVDRSIRDLKQLAPSSQDPQTLRALQAALEQVKQDKGLIEVLQWFNDSVRLQGVVKRLTDTDTVRLGNGDEIQNDRTPRQLVQAFRGGEKLSAKELHFLDSWARQSTKLATPLDQLKSMSNGEKGLKLMQNVVSDISEARYQSMAGGEISLDPDLLDGLGGDSQTLYRDQAVLSLWSHRDDIVAVMQDVSLLMAQAQSAVAAGGDFAQYRPGHVDPFRQVKAGLTNPQRQPNPSAEPGRSSLSQRHARVIQVGQETAEYHAQEPGASDDQLAHFGLKAKELTSRKDRVKALNAQLGISEDGKSLQPGTEAAPRHAQQEVLVDPRFEPGRSIPQEGPHAVKAFDDKVGSGLVDAARPARPRSEGV